MPGSRYVTRAGSVDAILRNGVSHTWHDVYHALIAPTWPGFMAFYGAIDTTFAVAYALVPGSITNARPGSFVDAFFFSVQTLWDTEIVVSLVGIDETVSQTIHARWSYLPDEIVWGGRYADVLSHLPDGRRRVDYSRFHGIEPDTNDAREAVR